MRWLKEEQDESGRGRIKGDVDVVVAPSLCGSAEIA